MARPAITAAFMVNGGLFADAHTHPWRTTPVLRSPLGALGMRRAQRSPRVFDATILQARLYSRGYHPTPPLSSPSSKPRSGDHPPGRGGVPAPRRGLHRRAPPPRAPLGPRCDRPRPRRHGRPLHRRQRPGPLRAPADPRRPPAKRMPEAEHQGLSRRPPDHQRAPRPPRRRHRRHRRTPRRGHPGHRQPLGPEREGRHHDQDDRPARAQRAVRPYLHPRGARHTRRAGAHRHLPRPPGRPRDHSRTPARRRSRHPQRRRTHHPGRHRRHRLPRLPGRAAVRRPGAADTLFEVAVIHHTQCGTGFLADPGFRRQAAEATGLPEAALEASAVADPHVTVRADVERLLASPCSRRR